MLRNEYFYQVPTPRFKLHLEYWRHILRPIVHCNGKFIDFIVLKLYLPHFEFIFDGIFEK